MLLDGSPPLAVRTGDPSGLTDIGSSPRSVELLATVPRALPDVRAEFSVYGCRGGGAPGEEDRFLSVFN